ncbi:uncharacterized protein LOC127241540 [Andrographis paniculata]|uniref:uncharacterized protein LOC127241540 n=1 Tax=Andrographis paniculata TaxID=175694 RepID=UPI0021E9A682|nr:uncharacterized protein LOC127241540 [Andrographis paniculata]
MPQMEESEGEKNNPIIVFFTNLLSGIKLPFPPKNTASEKDEPAVAAVRAEEPLIVKSPAAEEDESGKPGVVAFPRRNFVPLKLEEADAEAAERSTNPAVLWQVYAIGGFFVLRWAWKRWNEHKGQKKPGDEPPPTTSPDS